MTDVPEFDRHEGLGDSYLALCRRHGVRPFVVGWMTHGASPDETLCVVWEDDEADTTHTVTGPRFMLPQRAFELTLRLRGAGAK
jgi:hypothetical protein